MNLLSRQRRPQRPGEWTERCAVTFIVTLAATGSVTLAARSAGMSRKAAYALKSRNPAFAGAWQAALAASRPARRQGNKVEEVHDHPFFAGRSDRRWRNSDSELRDRLLSALTANRGDPVARAASLP